MRSFAQRLRVATIAAWIVLVAASLGGPDRAEAATPLTPEQLSLVSGATNLKGPCTGVTCPGCTSSECVWDQQTHQCKARVVCHVINQCQNQTGGSSCTQPDNVTADCQTVYPVDAQQSDPDTGKCVCASSGTNNPGHPCTP